MATKQAAVIAGLAAVFSFAPAAAHAQSATTSVGDISICGRPGTNAFIGCYYQGKHLETFRMQRTDSAINFNWGTSSPHGVIAPDNWSAKWWGLFTFDSGVYEFTVQADDGARLNVANETIIDKWFDQPATTYKVRKTMTAGQHGVIAEYYENWGQAVMKVSWRKVRDTQPPPPAPAGPYYPNAAPSAWYVLPGQQLSVRGTGFAPHETVLIENQAGGVPLSAQADGSGSFSSASMAVPYAWKGSIRSFTVKGASSGAIATPDPIRIVVGTFYPQIAPSSWWVKHGETVHVSGTGFAPNEQVRLRVNGAAVAQGTADGSGNVGFDLSAPSSGTSATIAAIGLSSDTSSTRTIYLHP